MKVSLNWIKQYTPVEVPIDELVSKIGSQLGEVESVTYLGARYEGVVTARVVSCVDHPNADRLHVCMIDDGGVVANVERDERGYVQVVCGATNVHADMFVAWLPPGATVPDSYGKDPFVLEARALRGVTSNGMLASPRELALGEGHEGILEIDTAVKPGTPFADVYELDDYIIEIENKMFTHRPDCFGHLGVAREIAGILGQQFTSPDWYWKPARIENTDKDNSLRLEVVNAAEDLVPRFLVIAMSGVDVQPSPMLLQTYLYRVGVRPINNVVDVTNYLMLATGQPLHAYDYDKIAALDTTDCATLSVRLSEHDDSLVLLNGKTITPRPEALVIASATKPLGLAGVMGGSETEVDETTKNIILECATFDMYSIRRTSMTHGLFTEAVTRFNKGQSPLQTDAIAAQAVSMFNELAGATVASQLYDAAKSLVPYSAEVVVTSGFINERLGLELLPEEIGKLLRHVEFDVVIKGKDIIISAPFWRTDIAIAEDIVEEVGRLYGYDALPLILPKRSLKPVQKDALLQLKARIRNSLARNGANEVLAYSFVHKKLMEKVGQDPAEAFALSNALSPDLQHYRISVLPSLLDKVHLNQKAGFEEFALFELGKSHALKHAADDPEGLPQEFEIAAFVYTAHQKTGLNGAGYYVARQYLDRMAHDLGLEFAYQPITEDPNVPIAKPYDLQRSAYVQLQETGEFVGIIGEFTQKTLKNLKIPQRSAGFEVNLAVLLSANKDTSRYRPLSRFPSVVQDITFRVSTSTQYATVAETFEHALHTAKPHDVQYDIEPKDLYSPNTEHLHVTFRVQFVSSDRTLSDKETTTMLDAAAAQVITTLQATRL